MEKPEFISDEDYANQGLNFEFLRNQGIQFIQELTGAFWTDYNEHDPGVTILEQLCYALTDLSYRVNFDIQDILFTDTQGGHTFHRPKDIFPSNPLTINDYRKVIIDQVKEARNVWLFPTTPKENSLKGLYKIFVDLDRQPLEETNNEQYAEKEALILNQIREVCCSHRNLCEDFEEIVVLEPLDVSVFADIEIDKIEEIETILAKIYFAIDQYFNPEIHFYSLQELLNQGLELQEIYTGPSLTHGFIREQDLPLKLDKIVISEIIKIMMEVEEVVSVKNLYLKINDEIYDNQFIIATHLIPRVIFGSSRDKKDYTISFYKNSVNHDNIQSLIFQRKLNELKSSNKRVYRENRETVDVESGRKLNLKEYYSIQNQFPIIYGIGEFGIPDKITPQRNAQAKQLKGYLLLFEQIMANYLAQLGNVKELFSLEAQLDQTYFYQTLDNIPHIQELYIHQPEEIVRDVQLGDTSFPKDYYLGIQELMRRQDNFSDRRNRFLDFLLAIHGEAYMEYSFSQKNYYFSSREFDYFLIQNKTRFLKHLPSINKNRVRAFNYLLSPESVGNLSGLEAKISILLGLDKVFQEESLQNTNGDMVYTISRKSSILDTFNQRNIKIIEENALDSRIELWNATTDINRIGLNADLIIQQFDFVDEEDLSALEDQPEIDEKALSKTAVFQLNKINSGFLRDGLNLENYLIGQTSAHDPDFYLIFQYPDIQKWLFIAQYHTYEEALRGCKAFVHFIRELNMQSEGFYLLEHLLLRPEVGDEKFGFYLLNEEGENFLRSTRRYTFNQRIEIVDQLKEYIRKSDKGKELYENFVVVQREDKYFEIRFKSERIDIELVSWAFPSVQEIHQKMDKLFEFIADVDNIPFEDKIAFYIQYDTGKPIPEDFFNYNISVLFPNWTARFHNREFKSMVENLIHENKPACVRAKVLWLDTEEMKRFESLYADWSERKQKNGSIKLLNNQPLNMPDEESSEDNISHQDLLNKLNHHFLEFLLKLHEEKE